MKTYEELYKSVITRRAEAQALKKRKQRGILTAIAVCACAAALAAVTISQRTAPPASPEALTDIKSSSITERITQTNTLHGGEQVKSTSQPVDRKQVSGTTHSATDASQKSSTSSVESTASRQQTVSARKKTTVAVPDTTTSTIAQTRPALIIEGENTTYIDSNPKEADRERLRHKQYAATALDNDLRKSVDYDKSDIVGFYGDEVGEEYLVVRLVTANGAYDVTIQAAHDYIVRVKQVE